MSRTARRGDHHDLGADGDLEPVVACRRQCEPDDDHSRPPARQPGPERACGRRSGDAPTGRRDRYSQLLTDFRAEQPLRSTRRKNPIMNANAIRSLLSAPTTSPRGSRRCRARRPRRRLPSRFPNPPMTHAAKAFNASSMPTWTDTVNIGATSTPAAPAIAVLMANAMITRRPVRMPISLAVSASTAVACSCRPSRVFVQNEVERHDQHDRHDEDEQRHGAHPGAEDLERDVRDQRAGWSADPAPRSDARPAGARCRPRRWR